jgi:hypothetical protein
MPLGEAREQLRQLVGDGHHCPCCTQLVKLYKRKINSTQARALILMFRECGRGWGHLPSLRTHLAPYHSNEEPKLRYWGLLEEEKAVRPDGGRSGWWRVTEAGEAWITGEITVRKYARVFDGRCRGLAGPEITIHDALSTKFDYKELMGRT